MINGTIIAGSQIYKHICIFEIRSWLSLLQRLKRISICFLIIDFSILKQYAVKLVALISIQIEHLIKNVEVRSTLIEYDGSIFLHCH